MQVALIEDALSLSELLRQAVSILWKDWPRNMQLSMLDQVGWRVTLRGTCPYCAREAVFMAVGGSFHQRMIGRSGNDFREIVSAMQCQGCLRFILSLVSFNETTQRVESINHYPVGEPDDSVPDDIPTAIGKDFSEALRCRWVDGYNATVEMCRRALEASCLERGAPEKLRTLQEMIDWVAGQGMITKSLQDMAHKIRLGGDRGAHPSERVLEKEDADAVIEFTWEYFQHVYVMPAKLAKFNFDRPKSERAKGIEATSGE